MKRKILDFIFILLLTLLLAFIANRVLNLWFFRLVFPETIATEDVYWEDFALKLRSHHSPEDKIIMVNIADGGRREIAKQLESINRYNPKVIGIDILFNCYEGRSDTVSCFQLKDTLGNSMLEKAIRDAENVVMVSMLKQKKKTAREGGVVMDSIELSDERFMQHASHGFGNLVLHGEVESIDSEVPIGEVRQFTPSYQLDHTFIPSFEVKVVELYDSVRARKFLKRNNHYEWISYRGGVTPYHYNVGQVTLSIPTHLITINSDSLLQGLYPKELLEGKIVLIGYLGDYLNDPAFESRFYTPLNPTFAGRSMPDMLGLTIHANIISMILNEDYIYELNSFMIGFISFIILSANILFFTWLLKKNSVWYDSLCFLVPVIQIILYSWLRLEFLASFNFRVDFEGILYLVAFVSFAVNLYYGPLAKILTKRGSTYNE